MYECTSSCTQPALVAADGADLDWCEKDGPSAGWIINREGLERGKTGNRPNKTKFDTAEAVPDKWSQHGVAPVPFRSDDQDRRAVLVDIEHAFGSIPTIFDVNKVVTVVLGDVIRRSDEQYEHLWASEKSLQTEVIDRSELARAVFGDEFGHNRPSLYPSGCVEVDSYLPHLGLGAGRFRSEPDVVWTNTDQSVFYVGEFKAAGTHGRGGRGAVAKSFAHRQVYNPWLVMTQAYPDATVVPVFVWVPAPNQVWVCELEYPDNDIVGARIKRTTQAVVRLESFAFGSMAPVFTR
jgi:hypothetical protein